MIDQRGSIMQPLHRHEVGYAFAKGRMTTQAATRLAGYLCRPLLDDGLISEHHDRRGFHRGYSITSIGKRALREQTD
jgi:hypothetical protein